MLKKIIALTLVILMILPMVVSCGSEGEAVSTTAPILGNASSGDDKLTEEEKKERAEIMAYVDELAEDNDFSGKSFVWIGGGSQAPTDSEETGDVAQDALYYRQRDIEEKFKISWENYQPEAIEGGDSGTHPVVEVVKKDVMAGSNAYDAGYGTPVAVCQPLFSNNTLTDAGTLDGIDFSNKWWTASLLDTYHINGATYFLNGAIVSSNYTDTHAVLFNKQVATDYNVGDLYSYVKDGSWTFDKMFEVASEIPKNESGAGAYRYSAPNGLAILYANDYSITRFNTDSTPYVPEAYPKELSDLSDKFSAVFGDDAQTVHTKGVLDHSTAESFEEKYDGFEGTQEMFVKNNILFYFATTGAAADLREEDVEFGILPLPKGSTAQENYISFAEPWSAFNVFVPKTTKDPTVTGVILEAMAALGLRYIKPAYYDNLLQGRSTYDKASKDMIDIIFETKVYDIIDFLVKDGSNNGDGAYVRTIKCAIQETNQGISSRYKMQARTVNNNIADILKNIENDK
ncbi:MAG: hypothetical protein IKM46_09415 [Clostridia bacterium]|nr:hypothetical protein [Clostridia bacterium]